MAKKFSRSDISPTVYAPAPILGIPTASEAVALERAAAELEREAGRLKGQAKAMRERRENAARLTRFARIPGQVRRLVARGEDHDEAVRLVAAELAVPLETVQHWIRQARRQAERLERARRNREIARLAARGWSNRAIAERFGLAPSYISTLLSRQIAQEGQKRLVRVQGDQQP